MAKKIENKEDISSTEHQFDENTIKLIKRLEKYVSITEDDDIEDIKKTLYSKAKHFAGIINEIINPETSMKSMYESNSFSEIEKNKLYNAYKKLQYIVAYYNRTELIIDDDENLKFFEKWISIWESVLPILKETLDKVKKSWEEKDREMDRNVEYLG